MRTLERILVTGGWGYVGSRLTEHLLNLGYPVRVLDLALYGRDGLEHLKARKDWKTIRKKLEWIQGDLRDPDAVRKAVKGVRKIIHLAAISNDPTGEVDETLTRQVNFDAVGMLLRLAREAGVTRFINASSSSVFGIKKDKNVTEKLEPEPLTAYSKYKMLSEWLVIAANSPDFVTVNIRPATICGYSPRQRFDLTVNKLTADAIRKRVITVHGGTQRRPNVGMTDVIHLYATLLQIPQWKIAGKTFNFGFENHRIIDIARIIQKELKDLGVKIQITATQDKRDYHISSTRALKELKYRPISSIRKEVQNLRRKLLDEKCFMNVDAPRHYNMKVMRLKRMNRVYETLAEK